MIATSGLSSVRAEDIWSSSTFLLAGLHKVKVEEKESSLRAHCNNPRRRVSGNTDTFVHTGRVTSLAHHDNPGSRTVILWLLQWGSRQLRRTINNTLRGRGFPGKKKRKRNECI